MFSSELHRSTVGLRLAHPFGAPWHADRGAGTSCKYQPGFSLHYAWAPVSFVPFHLFAKAQLTFEKFTQTPKCFNNHTLPPAAPALWAVSIYTDRLTWAGCLWRIHSVPPCRRCPPSPTPCARGRARPPPFCCWHFPAQGLVCETPRLLACRIQLLNLPSAFPWVASKIHSGLYGAAQYMKHQISIALDF